VLPRHIARRPSLEPRPKREQTDTLKLWNDLPVEFVGTNEFSDQFVGNIGVQGADNVGEELLGFDEKFGVRQSKPQKSSERSEGVNP